MIRWERRLDSCGEAKARREGLALMFQGAAKVGKLSRW